MIPSQRKGGKMKESEIITGCRLEGFTAASPSPPAAAPAPPAAPPAAAAAPLQLPPAPSSVPVSSAPVHLASPLKFSGESSECRPFLIQCDLHFSMDPNAFASVQARVAFMVSHMTGRAAAWATAEWSRGAQVCQTAQDFSQALLRVFDQTSPAREASSALLKIQQGCLRVVDYALEFRTLAADSGWNETSIIGAFMDGLAGGSKGLSGSIEPPVYPSTRVSLAPCWSRGTYAAGQDQISTRKSDRERLKEGACFLLREIRSPGQLLSSKREGSSGLRRVLVSQIKNNPPRSPYSRHSLHQRRDCIPSPVPERKAMEEYITASLRVRHHPSLLLSCWGRILLRGVFSWVTSITANHISMDPAKVERGYQLASSDLQEKGNTTVLTVVDRFSKMAHFIPLPKLPSAKETAQVMINHVFRIHGLPTDIVSDRGPQFVSVFWKEFCRLLGATVSLSSGYHPESNGQTERMNQELETCLRCLVAQNKTTWSQHLTWIEYAHNTLPTAATGLSPFHVVHGYQPPVFSGCLRTRGYRSIGSCSGQEKSQDLGSCTGHVAERTGSNGMKAATQTVAVGRLQHINQARKCGFLQKTFHYTSIPENWRP
ncbi:hypothetical protein L3Q82_021170, partial [Scortum barcoo]